MDPNDDTINKVPAESIQLPLELRKELKEAFDLIDTKNAGFIESLAIVDVLQILGYRPTEAEYYDMIQAMEKNKKGVIYYEDFENEFPNFNKYTYTEDEVKLIFGLFDPDNMGYVDMVELERIQQILGLMFSPHEMSEMLYEVDRDGDRKLNYPEFRRVLIKDEDEWGRS